jgi:hypothetical protein
MRLTAATAKEAGVCSVAQRMPLQCTRTSCSCARPPVNDFELISSRESSGAIHLTGLFLLSKHLTAHNAEVLLPLCRGKSRRKLERLIAAWFPRPDVPPKVQALGKVGLGDSNGSPFPTAGPSGPAEQTTLPGTGATPPRPKVEPLSADRFLIQFTAGAELHDKLEQAQQLLSHAVPSGDLAQLFERALDALLQRERKRRTGAGKPRKRRELEPDSRHVPVEVARQVWERDAGQCTFVDADGRRCSERRFLTLRASPSVCIRRVADR